jgi:hypothetical protein
MEVRRGIEIRLHFIGTARAPEELASARLHATASAEREPLASCAAAGAVLAGTMRIDLDRHRLPNVRFLFCQTVDLASEVIGLLPIEAPGFGPSFGFDHA